MGCADIDILAAIDREVPDLFDDRIGARYNYEDGWTVYRSWDAKAGKKRIGQAGPKGNGQEPQQTQLYELTKTKAAVAAHKTIFLVESEDNAELINSLPEEERCGGFATSARMGAANFHLCNVEPLRGAQVIAIVDNDKSGETWAFKVLAKVRDKAATLDFAKGKIDKEHADSADHIAAGYTLDELVPWYPPQQDQKRPPILSKGKIKPRSTADTSRSSPQ